MEEEVQVAYFRIQAILGSSQCSANMAPKRCRPRTCHFAKHDLVEKWSDLLNLRDAGFQWDGSSYQSNKSSGINVEGLKLYERPLEGLLQVATSGFPAHLDLRCTFSHLQAKYGILSSDKVVTQQACDDATENWRLMAKMMYNLKKAGTDVPSLRHLIEIIELPKHESHEDDDSRASEPRRAEAQDSAEAPPRPESFLQLQDVEELYKMDIDIEASDEEGVEVEMVSMRCSCPECVQRSNTAKNMQTIVIQDEHDEEKKPKPTIPIANPKSGHQRHETVSAEPQTRQKYSTKQAPRTSSEMVGTARAKEKAKKGQRRQRASGTATSIPRPIRMVHRKSGKAKPEAYLLAGGKYLAGQSSARTSKYFEDVQELKVKIEANEVVFVQAARAWLRTR